MLLEIVKNFAEKNNVIAGVSDALPLDAAKYLETPFVTPFVTKDIEKRVNPAATFKGAKSVIAVGVSTPHQSFALQNSATPLKKGATLSSLGVDADYHNRVRAVLALLKEDIAQHMSFKSRVFVDSGTLDERAFAFRAGIGFYGRNGLIISSKFGSRFNIGLMVTDIETDSFSPENTMKCPPNCNRCIESCPGQALTVQGLNPARCVSYFTQKDNLTEDEKILMGTQLYGCDICTDVCPFNAPREPHKINPQEWLNLSDEEFNKKYAHTAMMWRGTDILRRNAQVTLSNA